MTAFALFTLVCPRCGLATPQLLPDDGREETTLPCLACGGELRKEKKLTPPACEWRPGGG